MKRRLKRIQWVLLFILVCCFIWLLFMNNTIVTLDYGFGIFKAPLLVTLLIAYLLGALSGSIPLFVFCLRLLRKNRSEHETETNVN